MLRDTVSGLEKILRNDVDAPKVVLVIGPPGSMKTSFCFSVMSRHLSGAGEIGMYLTLEETSASHAKNMKSIGIDYGKNLFISDFTDIRELELVGDESPTDYISLIERLVRNFKQKHGKAFTMLTIDSLGALYSLMDDGISLRKSMYHFFKNLREMGLFTMLIMEGSIADGKFYSGTEAFLSDGVIYLGMDSNRGKITRFVQVGKMRACDHSMERHALEVGRGGLQVLGPMLGNS
ncbi:MAG: RAD55 family ATPase [Thermoplasmata archaeon]|uniref:RAD55 family ATPase n=1 Tax=Candidatus Sysuiplasma superficiale TaxID=2823368 RepID=A0A8J7YUT5_9ARCH|nr:signal transduction protein [Candidatus Sysuiplasma superficiale]MBX8645089.1 RAD55 family ATPase [Candidatus Sysuiplasma superficiale]